VERFFDDRNGPFPYPLVFHKTYPGTLFPTPFARHCRVQLVSPAGPNWGNFWQITYTTYSPATRVKSLTWPLSRAETEELQRVRETWLEAESRPRQPGKVAVSRELNVGPGENQQCVLVSLEGRPAASKREECGMPRHGWGSSARCGWESGRPRRSCCAASA
jgi:hypothetical protein